MTHQPFESVQDRLIREAMEHKKTVEGNTTFDAEAAMIDDTYMVGKISVKNHPFVEHFKFLSLKSITDSPFPFIIPAYPA